MGIVHLGLVKLKEGISSDVQGTLQKELIAFKEKIPVIQYISAGDNFAPQSAKKYDFAFVLRVNSKEDLDAYLKHPVHLEFVTSAKPFLEELTIVDYEG